MERQIPLFPLNIFLLPGDYTQLYIFEDRYKQLIGDCVKTSQTFGIAFTSRLNTKNYGCEVELVEVLKTHPGGEMDIVIRARSVFQLKQFFFQKKDRLYPGGFVSDKSGVANASASEELLASFKKYLVQNDNYNSELLSKENLGIFDVANELYLSDIEKLELVNLDAAPKMDRYLINYIRYLEIIQDQENSVYKNIYLN